jgi:hypothetical protein
VTNFGDFLSAEADAVLRGSSPAYRPELAIEARRQHSDG